MHIEPGVVDVAKMTLSYGTAIAAVGFAGKLAMETIKKDGVFAAGCAQPFHHRLPCFAMQLPGFASSPCRGFRSSKI